MHRDIPEFLAFFLSDIFRQLDVIFRIIVHITCSTCRFLDFIVVSKLVNLELCADVLEVACIKERSN